MKKLITKFTAIVVSVMCAFCLTLSVFSYLDYSDTNEIIISLSFTSDKAYCSAEISGAIGTTSITDCTVTLTDSKGNEVKSWSGLSAVGYRLIVVETVQGVKKGETYTLSVTATVNRDGRSETVSDSFTRTYN